VAKFWVAPESKFLIRHYFSGPKDVLINHYLL